MSWQDFWYKDTEQGIVLWKEKWTQMQMSALRGSKNEIFGTAITMFLMTRNIFQGQTQWALYVDELKTDFFLLIHSLNQ